MRMRARLLTWKHRLKEWLRHGYFTSRCISKGLSTLSMLKTEPIAKLELLYKAIRLRPTVARTEQLVGSIQEALSQIEFTNVNWAKLEGSAQPQRILPKGIILKAPVSENEKGVIYLTFENQWIRLLRSGQAESIAKQYDLVLGPSHSPPPDIPLMMMMRFWPGTLHTMLSNEEDADLYRILSPKLKPVPLLSSSWVDPEAFTPWLSDEKKYDIVMLANFSAIKRHWLFFDTLRKLPSTLKVLLIGVPLDGRDEHDLQQEMALFGVEKQCDILVRPSREELMSGLAQGRISLIFSRREGGCIAVAESLFANTPVGVCREARMGSKAFINEETGVLLDRGQLPQQILQFLKMANCYRPRQWALDNISCHRSLHILNNSLREAALSEGSAWTDDLLPFVKGVVPSYLLPETEEAMRPWYENFERQFGLKLGSSLARPSRQPVMAS